MIRGFIPRSIKPIPSPIDLRSIIKEHTDLLKTIQDKRDALETLHSEAQHEVEQRLAHLDALIEQVKLIQKGDKGDMPVAGVDYPIPENGQSVDHAKVVNDVLAKIPPPQKGQDAKVDYDKVARLAARLIKPKEVDHAAIADSVVELLVKGKKKLHVKHLDGFAEGLEQTMAPIRSLAAGFRGGGDTVAAGSNVTITSVNGVKTISSSGGSGFTQLTATETPNGVLTVFTFALASAQPSFIISDGVWMEATAQDSTVNWTWNNVTKKATMTIPPASAIKGIV